MAVRVNIEELKKKIGAVDGSLPKQIRPFSLYPKGIPSSSVVEIFGSGKTEFLSQFLKEYPSLKTVWIEKEISINPYALWQRGVDIGSILFIECGAESVWATQQVLKSQIFQVITLSQLEFKEMELRKIQLLIEKTESHLFLLSTLPHQSWIPALQLDVNEGIKVLRQRGFQ